MTAMNPTRWTEADIPGQKGRVAIVTGANTGLGFDTARVLAEKGATVVLAVRDAQKGAAAVDRIRARTPHAELHLQLLDLGSLASVRSAAAALRAAFPRIDLLINNAGVMIPPRTLTPDGFELQIGTNHLGHFALTGLLLDRLLDVPDSRVVVVASLAHRAGAINFDDLHGERRYRPGAAYAQSKLATILFCYELHRRLTAASRSTIALAAHPGYTTSELMRNVWSPLQPLVHHMSPWFGQPPAQGALPQLLAATAAHAQAGQYWGPDGLFELKGYPKQVVSSRASHDVEIQKRLWAVSEQLTGVRFPV